MSEKDEITRLFRNRLADTEITVREGFWEQLQEDVESSAASRKKAAFFSPKYYRAAAAASVIFVLGAASAAFWCFSPEEEIKEAFTQVAALTPEGCLNGDGMQESFPSIHHAAPTTQNTGMKQPANGIPAGKTAQSEYESESVSVRFSITIRQQVQIGGDYFNNQAALYNGNAYSNASGQADDASDAFSAVPAEEEKETTPSKLRKSHKWALKAALGTSLPKGECKMPLVAGVTVERSLGSRFALETGLLYNRLHAGRTLHTLEVPAKLSMVLASAPKADCYVLVGGAAEKCIAGASDNSFRAEPVRLSAMAGLGVRYKLNDRFALFAEPTVSHHFKTDSEAGTLRTERPTNLNLLCGVRMTY